MKFGFPKIHTKDLEKSKKFYTELLNLKVTREINPHPGFKLIFMENEDGQIIEIIQDDASNFNYDKNHKMALLFTVDHIEDALAEVQSKGFEIDGELIVTPTGVKFFYVIDPSGVPIQITQL